MTEQYNQPQDRHAKIQIHIARKHSMHKNDHWSGRDMHDKECPSNDPEEEAKHA